MSDDIPDLYDAEVVDEESDDVLVLLDRLEELVGVGRRMPFSTRVMVEEEEFLEAYAPTTFVYTALDGTSVDPQLFRGPTVAKAHRRQLGWQLATAAIGARLQSASWHVVGGTFASSSPRRRSPTSVTASPRSPTRGWRRSSRATRC